MTVTKTLLNLGPHPINYLAVQRVAGFPHHVKAIAGSRCDAISAVLLKKEAHESRQQRFDEARVSVLCMCHGH